MITTNSKLQSYLLNLADVIISKKQGKYIFNKGKERDSHYSQLRPSSSRYLCSLLIYKGFNLNSSLTLLNTHKLLNQGTPEVINFLERFSQFSKSITGKTIKMKYAKEMFTSITGKTL